MTFLALDWGWWGRGDDRLLSGFGTRHVERRRVIWIIEGGIAITGARTNEGVLLIHGLAIIRIISIGLHGVNDATCSITVV
jgi:hypothetical protein